MAAVRVVPSGLACMTGAQGELPGLPTVAEAAKRYYPDHTVLHINLSRPREHFKMVMTTYPSNGLFAPGNRYPEGC